jgi:hypothetical protein
MVVEAARVRHEGADISRLLANLGRLAAPVVDRVLERSLQNRVDQLWQDGWQPAELVRQARRGCDTAAAARLVASAIATDHAARRADTLDARWIAQVDEFDLPPSDGRAGWMKRWAAAEHTDRTSALDAAVDALATVLALPSIEVLLPPPGGQQAGSEAGARARTVVPPPTTGAQADPVLERVRRLLAKAESSTFEAEATAFTAKAQELMTRHAIDAALLHGTGDDTEQTVSVRVPVDNPYVKAKSLLLQIVAQHGRCRSVALSSLAMSSVIGFPADVAAVELLFTSLLLQAQRALNEAARTAPPGTRTRRQSYRSAFLVAYAQRIDDRLGEINDAVYADVEATQGGSFLPALRSRAEQIDAEVSERFGTLASSTVRGGYDAAGWAHGRHAADQARLTGESLPASASR